MKVIADRDVCIGAGMCVVAAGIFDQDEDGLVVIAEAEEVPAEEQEVIRLQHFDGLTHVEIAERLAVPPGT